MDTILSLILTPEQAKTLDRLLTISIETGKEIIINRPKMIADRQKSIKEIKEYLKSTDVNESVKALAESAIKQCLLFIKYSDVAVEKAQQDKMIFEGIQENLKNILHETGRRQEDNT